MKTFGLMSGVYEDKEEGVLLKYRRALLLLMKEERKKRGIEPGSIWDTGNPLFHNIAIDETPMGHSRVVVFSTPVNSDKKSKNFVVGEVSLRETNHKSYYCNVSLEFLQDDKLDETIQKLAQVAFDVFINGLPKGHS
jgi:hypothetical protein